MLRTQHRTRPLGPCPVRRVLGDQASPGLLLLQCLARARLYLGHSLCIAGPGQVHRDHSLHESAVPCFPVWPGRLGRGVGWSEKAQLDSDFGRSRGAIQVFGERSWLEASVPGHRCVQGL